MRVRYTRVPVLTEEYCVHVFVGDPVSIKRAAHAHLRKLGLRNVTLLGEIERGIVWRTLPDCNPIIGVNSALSPLDAIATLAHEASHAMGHIAQHTELDDDKGEFRAHGVGAVIRRAGPLVAPQRRRKHR